MLGFSPFLSSRNQGWTILYSFSCSPSALDKLFHCFPREALAVSSRSVALYFTQTRVTGDCCDHMCAASNLGEPARCCLASAVCGNVGASGLIAKLAKPITKAC